MKKSTIYVDIDDDIAAIIDKVSAAAERIVAVVLPKRAAVLQSSVNMKLLKRAADDVQKSVVLVTSESAITALAGASGMHVAETLTSKPKIPVSRSDEDQSVVEVDQTDSVTVESTEPQLDPTEPIGKLAGIEATEDSIEMDADEEEAATDTDEPTEKPAKKDRKLKVPNFGVFRVKLVLGLLVLLALAGAGYYAFMIAPKAQIALKTEQSDAPTKIVIQAKASVTTVNTETNELPALLKTDTQKLSDTFTVTGQKDAGTKASGSVKFYNCSQVDKLGDITRTVPAGTGISSGGKTFITQTAVDVDPSGFAGSTCKSDKPSAIVKVVAIDNGDTYNLSARDYSVAGFSSMTAEDSVGMSGGVSKIVKVVSQEDVEAGKQKLVSKAASDTKGKLAAILTSEGYVAIQETYVTEQGEAKPAVAVGDEATGDVAITMDITATMLGVRANDLGQLLESAQKKTIDQNKQKIYDSGAKAANLSVTERPAKDSVTVSVIASGKVGPILKADDLKSLIAGKKAGDAKQILEARPGVKEASIKLSPFWVFSIPKNNKKITITVDGSVL